MIFQTCNNFIKWPYGDCLIWYVLQNNAKMKSYIKISLIIIVHSWLSIAYQILWIEHDIFLLYLIIIKEVKLLVFSGIVIHPKKTMLHLHWNIIILLDCYRLLLLHLAAHQDLFRWFRLTHEKLVHLFLFFSSILHWLKVASKSWRSSWILGVIKGYWLNLIWRYVV